MPSLPPFDGIALPSCAGIRPDGTTIRAIDARGVDGKSLPITPSTGEHNIFSSHHYNHGGVIWSDGCTTNAVGPSKFTRPLGKRVDGTLACYHRGGNAIAKLGSPFNASSVLSLPPTPNHGGDSRRVDGTLACYHRGGNAIAELGPSFLADSVFSHPLSTNDGGEGRLGGRPCYGTQSPTFGICHVYMPRIC
jgi:hypothetical protein